VSCGVPAPQLTFVPSGLSESGQDQRRCVIDAKLLAKTPEGSRSGTINFLNPAAEEIYPRTHFQD
jgi:hypothetical protein